MTDRGRELAASAGLLALALLAGTALGNGWAGLCAGLAGIAGRHLYHLTRLARDLATGEKIRGPVPGGLWRTVYGGARALRTRGRKRKRRLGRFLSRFRQAAAALPDAALVVGAHGHIEWLNPAAGRLLGLRRPEDIGAQLVERVRDPELAAYLLAGDYDRSVEIRSPADASKILSVRAAPFGSKRQRLVVARDVTRVRLADDAAADFAASASHELRTPLTVISGFIEELSLSPRNAEDAEALALMRDQAARMNGTVEALLELSRLQLDAAPAEHVPVRVPALLEEIAAEAVALSGAREHVIELEVDTGLELIGDEKLLRSVFSNLVANAIHHTPPRSEVVVRWWREGNGARLSVRDSGEGIAARHVPRLTERFYRVDESRTRHAGGTGLGLAIVKRVLDVHGADLRVETAPGDGSTFTCLFPPSRVAAGEEGAGTRHASSS